MQSASQAAWSHGVVLISVSVALSQMPAYAAIPWNGANASRGVPVYAPAFASTKLY